MLDPVTHRYAEALYSLAKREGALEAVRGDVERLAAELAAPGAAAVFDPRVPIDDRRAKLGALVHGAHAFVRNFVALAIDKRREGVLRGLGEAFHEQYLRDRGAAEGVVQSARPLAAEDVERLAAALGKRLGKSVTLESEIVPEVLGGIRVIVGSQMIDGSVRGRLDGLAKRMASAPLPSLAEA